MIKKTFSLLLFIVLSPFWALSQYAINLDINNVSHFGNSYLIDIPLKPGIKNLCVKDFNKLIPIKAYVDYYRNADIEHSLDTIFVVNKASNGKRAFVEYVITRSAIVEIDSLPSINRKLSKYIILKKHVNHKSTIIYDRGGIGTVGGGDDDIMLAKKKKIETFIKEFETANNVQINDVSIVGDGGGEGGVIYYYPLSRLTLAQKIKFISEGRSPRNLDQQNGVFSAIYFPIIVADSVLHPPVITEKMQEKLDADKIYIQIENMPSYPDGEKAFVDLFKNISFDVRYRNTIISFVVEKNGSLTDIKVLRGANEQTSREIIKAAKKSKRWHPGLQYGKPVRVSVSRKIWESASYHWL